MTGKSLESIRLMKQKNSERKILSESSSREPQLWCWTTEGESGLSGIPKEPSGTARLSLALGIVMDKQTLIKVSLPCWGVYQVPTWIPYDNQQCERTFLLNQILIPCVEWVQSNWEESKDWVLSNLKFTLDKRLELFKLKYSKLLVKTARGEAPEIFQAVRLKGTPHFTKYTPQHILRFDSP